MLTPPYTIRGFNRCVNATLTVFPVASTLIAGTFINCNNLLCLILQYPCPKNLTERLTLLLGTLCGELSREVKPL